MGCDNRVPLFHPDDLRQLRKQVQPVRNQQYYTVLCFLLQILEDLLLGLPVQCRKRIIQNQQRAFVA